MRLVTTLLVAGACAACRDQAPRPAASLHPLPSPSAIAPQAIEPDAGAPPPPDLDALARLASALAPGMRELSRGESALPASVPIDRTGRDTCVRAVVAASSDVVAALVAGARTLDVSVAGRTTTLGARGPVCVTKDADARVEIQGSAKVARYVVWGSP